MGVQERNWVQMYVCSGNSRFDLFHGGLWNINILQRHPCLKLGVRMLAFAHPHQLGIDYGQPQEKKCIISCLTCSQSSEKRQLWAFNSQHYWKLWKWVVVKGSSGHQQGLLKLFWRLNLSLDSCPQKNKHYWFNKMLNLSMPGPCFMQNLQKWTCHCLSYT